jgi:hypothetical protein
VDSRTKRPGREVDRSPQSIAELKKEWSCTSVPAIPPWTGTNLALNYIPTSPSVPIYHSLPTLNLDAVFSGPLTAS